MADYNKGWKMNYYKTKEIEMVKDSYEYLAYFKNIEEFAELIKTNAELAKKLKELL